jgi:DNA-binding transcriptional LysR family regulator
MSDLDLRRLRYFLTLADELNYGRAAEALHIAQPALSRSIAALERELGVTLFERSRSGTRLAAAGELLRDDARELLHKAETLQRRVRLADREGRSVTIGFMPGLIVTPMVRRLEERCPGLRVDVVRTSWTEQIDALRDGRFDASFARRPFNDDGLTIVDLFAEPRVAALPIDHPRAGSNEILLADLAGDLLLQPATVVPEWRGEAAPPVPPGDDRDARTASSPTVEEKLELVAAGRGIVILPASTTRYYNRPDVTYARVVDLPDTGVCLVVESRRRSDVLRELVEIARTMSVVDHSGPTDAVPASVGTR